MMEELPLLELFTRLQRAGLPLGLDDYQAVVQALQGGYGVGDRAALERLCRTLWVRSKEEDEILRHYFKYLIDHKNIVANTPLAIEQEVTHKTNESNSRENSLELKEDEPKNEKQVLSIKSKKSNSIFKSSLRLAQTAIFLTTVYFLLILGTVVLTNRKPTTSDTNQFENPLPATLEKQSPKEESAKKATNIPRDNIEPKTKGNVLFVVLFNELMESIVAVFIVFCFVFILFSISSFVVLSISVLLSFLIIIKNLVNLERKLSYFRRILILLWKKWKSLKTYLKSFNINQYKHISQEVNELTTTELAQKINDEIQIAQAVKHLTDVNSSRYKQNILSMTYLPITQRQMSPDFSQEFKRDAKSIRIEIGWSKINNCLGD